MKGTYLLILNIPHVINAKIGSLGILAFPASYYIYIGSALNNLEKRISRHKKKKKYKRWHIDYLTTRKEVKIEDVLYRESLIKLECEVAETISEYGTGVPKFGCSDCSCKSHLIRVGDVSSIDWASWRRIE